MGRCPWSVLRCTLTSRWTSGRRQAHNEDVLRLYLNITMDIGTPASAHARTHTPTHTHLLSDTELVMNAQLTERTLTKVLAPQYQLVMSWTVQRKIPGACES